MKGRYRTPAPMHVAIEAQGQELFEIEGRHQISEAVHQSDRRQRIAKRRALREAS